MSLANGKIRDVIRTRCARSYCDALPLDLTVCTRRRRRRRRVDAVASCENFNPPYSRLSFRRWVTPAYIIECTISFLCFTGTLPLTGKSVPSRRVRILEESRSVTAEVPVRRRTRIMGAALIALRDTGFNGIRNTINLRFALQVTPRVPQNRWVLKRNPNLCAPVVSNVTGSSESEVCDTRIQTYMRVCANIAYHE